MDECEKSEEPVEQRAPSVDQSVRFALAGISAPLAVVVNYFVHEKLGEEASGVLSIAVASLIGTGTTILSLCFFELRDLLFALVLGRRRVDWWRKGKVRRDR